MAENTGDKTEQATPKKLEEALKKGQIPQSAEVQTVFVLLFGLAAKLGDAHRVIAQYASRGSQREPLARAVKKAQAKLVFASPARKPTSSCVATS